MATNTNLHQRESEAGFQPQEPFPGTFFFGFFAQTFALFQTKTNDNSKTKQTKKPKQAKRIIIT